MKSDTKKAQPRKVQGPTTAKRRWETPRIESSEVFTRAGLACCLDPFNNPTGSAGANLPLCD